MEEQVKIELGQELLSTLSQIDSDSIRETDLEDERKMVTMSNQFVVGIEQSTRLAHKISRICIAQLKMGDDTLPLTKISSDDILAMGYTRERLTSHADSVLNEILSMRIKLSTIGAISNAARITGINVFSMATILPGEGAIVVQLNPLLKEHFLHLTQDYTQYEMKVALKMNSVAASHLHELLIARSRQFGARVIEFGIEDLAALLGYTPKQKRHVFSPSDFTNSTIKRAVNMINELTECRVAYFPVKTGRKITSVRFLVSSEWRTVKEKEQALRELQEMSGSDVLKGLLERSNASNQKALESGDGSIFPEEILRAGKGAEQTGDSEKCST